MSVAPPGPLGPQQPKGAPPTGNRGMGPPPGGRPRPSAKAGLRLAAYFLRYLRPVVGLVSLLGVGVVLIALGRLAVTFLPYWLTRHFNDGAFLWYLGFVAVVMVLIWGLSCMNGYLNVTVQESMLRSLRHRVFSNLERLSMQAIYSQGPGQFTQQLSRDVFIVRDLYGVSTFQSVQNIVSSLVALVFMVVLDPWLTLAVVVGFGATSGVIRLANRRVEANARRGRELMQDILTQVIENVGGYRDIVAAGRFSSFVDQFDDLAKRSQSVNVRTGVWAQVSGLAPSMMILLLTVCVYYFGFKRAHSVDDTGSIITYALLLAQLFPGIQSAAGLTTSLSLAVPSMEALRETLEQPDDPSRAAATPLQESVRSIRFDHMNLDLEHRRIIDDMTFELPAGKLTAIVGQSGSGKTTLFHLMLRLLEPTGGAILVNDRPLRSYTLESLRTRIGFIPQSPFIFNETLRENILLATPEKVSPEQLARAVDLSQLSEVVARRQHEGGLDAVAGYMGNRLSGGEKQRVALARLLLRDPEVIICDEYTANVDVKTARLIHESMRTIFAGRTRVVITHELYSARGADWIIVIDRGHVVQQGTHEQLRDQPGLYRELLEVQKI